MRAGQVVAVVSAVVLLVPGLCFTVVSFDVMAGRNGQMLGLFVLVIGLGILALAARLFWIGIRRPQAPALPSRRPDN
jgi:hypothetical protein